MDEDVEVDYDETCPKCGHSPTHSRTCDAPYCEDGLIDMYEDDPINFSPGEESKRCDECNGTGRGVKALLMRRIAKTTFSKEA